MNIEEYISSGTIEAYVLGIATTDEVCEIEQLIEQYPSVRATVAEQEALLAQYAQSHSANPPEHLKQNIWAAIQEEPNSTASKIATQTETPKISLTEKPSSKKSWKGYAMAASIALLIASGICNMWMMQEHKKMSAEIANISAQEKKLLDGTNKALIAAQKAKEALDIMSLPSLKKINLAGVGTHAQHSGMLYWDAATGNVFLDLNSMPAAPEGKQYQLWAIVDGKPVDAGMYDPSSGDMIFKMKTFFKAEMFAVTIEKMGGSPIPTMDQMVVAGKTS
ncbi:MAG: anti-sigma factor [Phycisphaerales bacterium]|nr:anti-sigma factor [Phycisphaerales bacterium]